MPQAQQAHQETLSRQIDDLAPWFHNIVVDGVPTAPEHFLGDYPAFKWAGFQDVIPQDLRGMSVLDVGCNAGFYALEMKRRGADRVVGIDSDRHYLQQAAFISDQFEAGIELHQLSVYEVDQLHEKFDLVIFMGVLYHLRHPLLALDLLHEHVVDELMLFQSMQRGSDQAPSVAPDYEFSDWTPFRSEDFPSLYFIENRYAGDPTNWFIPNKGAVEAMLRSAGFRIESNPEREVYLCRRDPAFAGPEG